MKKDYALFLRRGIDLKSLGIDQDRENSAYFCTPKGASIIGITPPPRRDRRR